MINPFKGRQDLFGKPLDRNALEKLLVKQDDKGAGSSGEQARQEVTPSQNSGIDLSDYVILESSQGVPYSYHPLLVPLEITHLYENWNTTHASLRKEDAHMLTIREFADFLKLLRSGDAYDGNGQKMDPERLEACFYEITEVRSPWRAEWLDAKFSKANVGKILGIIPKTQMQITYHIIDNGKQKEITEPLEDCLMRDMIPGIDLDYWTANATSQGLPTKNTQSGKLYYWSLRNGSIAWFDANSDRAVLDCFVNPWDSGPALRVRAALPKK